jgi:hypothetical protein
MVHAGPVDDWLFIIADEEATATMEPETAEFDEDDALS